MRSIGRLTSLFVAGCFGLASLTACTTGSNDDTTEVSATTKTTMAPAPTPTATVRNAVEIDPTTSPAPVVTTTRPSPSPSANPAQDPKIWKKVQAVSKLTLKKSAKKDKKETTATIIWPTPGTKVDGDRYIFPKVQVTHLKTGDSLRWMDKTDKVYPTSKYNPLLNGQLATFNDVMMGNEGTRKHQRKSTITMMLVAGGKNCMSHINATAAQGGIVMQSKTRPLPTAWNCHILDTVKVTSIRDGEETQEEEDAVDPYSVVN